MTGFLRNALLLVLALTLVFNVGCVSSASYSSGHATLGGDGVASCDDGDHGAKRTGLRMTRGGGGAELAVYAFVGLAIVTVFALDLLLLPFTHHDPFPCCRGVISICH